MTGQVTPRGAASKSAVAYGEVLLRLKAPGFERLLQTPRLEVCVGGAEMNVLASLARFGHGTRMITTLPDDPLGDGALGEIRALGIGTAGVGRAPGRIGLYFAESGHGARAGRVLYDRARSAFALDETTQSWADLLAGADLLHLTGITPALSAHAAANCLLAAREARRLGMTVSLDMNFRAQLWAQSPASFEAALAPRLQETHILFANCADLKATLRLASNPDSGAPFEEFERLSAAALERLPELRLLCTCVRLGEHADRAQLTALGRSRQEYHRSADRRIHSMVDRIGTGDAFAAGVLHGYLEAYPTGRALEFGLAAAVLKHSISGDVNRVNREEVESCLTGASAGLLRR
jgi:2-dehydro-3-deoxygluconokinase